MITGDSTIKIGVPITALVSLVSYGFWWGAENIATKSDVDALHGQQQESYVELMIQLTELQIRPFEKTSGMTAAQQREYEQLKSRLQRLLEEKDRLLRE